MIAFHADAAIGDRAKQIEFARQLLPARAATQAVGLLRTRPELVPPSSQLALNLAPPGLVTCPDEPPEAWQEDAVARRLGLLLLALAEYSTLLQTAAYLGVPITTLLQSWHDSGMAGDSFGQWLTTDGPGGEVAGGGAISRRWDDFVRASVFRPRDEHHA